MEMSLEFLDDFLAEIQDNDSGVETISNQTESSPSESSSSSGQGSPFSYDGSFTNSPEALTWETDMNNDFWGSILDDLPAELSGNESENNDSPNLSDEPLVWTNSITDSNVTSILQGNSELNTYSNHNDLEVIDDDFLNIKDDPMICIDKLVNNSEEQVPSITQTVTNEEIKEKTEIVPNTKSIILKPIALLKGSNNIGEIKSHIKIGNNIFAIIQNTDNLKQTNINPVNTSFKENVIDQKEDRCHTLKNEHDYADEEYNQDDSFETTGVSKGFGPRLSLTDEEKKLLEVENVTLPEDAPLTKEEEKALKKVRRKIKNKQSAMESRRRRKEYIDNLERRVKHCTDSNNMLKKKVDRLSEDNQNLLQQLKQLQSVVSNSVKSTKTANKGTCLAVLLLSFALFYLPFNPMHHVNAGGKADNSNLKTASPVFRSRALLSVEEGIDYDNYTTSVPHYEHDFNVNDSLIYSDEMKARLEKLLISEDHDIALTKLQEYVNTNSNYGQTLEGFQHSGSDLNILEVNEEFLTARASDGNKK